MSRFHNIRVGVLSGGSSTEHDASLTTGETLVRELSKAWDTRSFYIDRDGSWRDETGAVIKPADTGHRIDVIVNGVHGEHSTTGNLQQTLEHLQLPYTGSGVLASSLARDRYRARTFLGDAVKHPVYRLLNADDMSDRLAYDLFSRFPQPSVVRPCSLGVSVGQLIVHSRSDIESALNWVFSLGKKAVIEEYIDGQGAHSGVIEGYRGSEYYVLPVVPNIVNPAAMKKVQLAALRAHKTLGLSGHSQTHVTVHPRRGVFLQHVDPHPRLNHHSSFVEALRSAGSTLEEFLEHIMLRAYRKYR